MKRAGASNAGELRRAIEALRQPFVHPEDICPLLDNQDGVFMCFVELRPANSYPSVIANLGGVNYGNSVAFRIPFNQVKDYGLNGPWLVPRNICIAHSRRARHGQRAPRDHLGPVRRPARPQWHHI